MSRPHNWQSLLQAHIKERYRRPFQWGVQDCALFAADWVFVCTGVDPAIRYRGTYDSAISAMRLLADTGGLAGLAQVHLGDEIVVQMASVGDIGLAAYNNSASLVIFGGSAWYGPAKEGITHLPSSMVKRVWRLPETT